MPGKSESKKSVLARAEELRTGGQPSEAAEVLKKFSVRNPEHADIQYCLGLAYHDAGDWEGAVTAYRKAAKLRPKHVMTHSLLGVVLRQLGQHGEAISALNMALKLDPKHIQTLNLIVMTLVEAGRMNEVAEYGLKSLKIKDQMARKVFKKQFKQRYSLAKGAESRPREIILENRRRHVIAFSLWGTNPDYTHGAIINARIAPYVFGGWICRFYCDDSVPGAILDELRKNGAEVVMMPPNQNFSGLFWRFFVANDPNVDLFLIRDCDSRLNSQEKVAVDEWIASDKAFHIMRDHPFHNELILAGMWGGTANLLPSLKEVVEEHFPAHANRHTDQAFLCDFVWPLIKSDCLSHDSYYKFNKALDFSSYGRQPRPVHVGGAIKNMPEWQPDLSPSPSAPKPEVSLGSSPMDDEIARIRRVFDKQLFFIGATEKSGSTWLQLMLDAHPEVACRGEGHFSTTLVSEVGQAFDRYSQHLHRLNDTVFDEIPGFPVPTEDHRTFVNRALISLLMAGYGDSDQLVALGEKTPGNIRNIRFLKHLIPDTKFIFMLRDGRDIAVSGWYHLKRQWGKEAGNEPMNNYARRIAKTWREDIEKAQSFSDSNPESCIWVRYEDLHWDINNQLSAVFSFLGVENSSTAINDCVAAGDFKNLAQGRDRGQEDSTSHFRKGIVGDWVNHLDDEAIKSFNTEAGEVLRDFGYLEEG